LPPAAISRAWRGILRGTEPASVQRQPDRRRVDDGFGGKIAFKAHLRSTAVDGGSR